MAVTQNHVSAAKVHGISDFFFWKKYSPMTYHKLLLKPSSVSKRFAMKQVGVEAVIQKTSSLSPLARK